MSIRVRFAPSPTGHVHIGNIRAAIFNWLFARHEKGTFLLRIEDTDRERSTPEAIATLLDSMQWLGLTYDAEPLYQTSCLPDHVAAAERLLQAGHAYKLAKGGGPEALVFRLPYDAESIPGVSTVGPAVLAVHPEVPVTVSHAGVEYAGISKKGKPVPDGASLAGFRDLVIVDAAGKPLFTLAEALETIVQGREYVIEGASELRFTRRQIQYDDLVKGVLAKPLDNMRDPVIVRSDGSPVFHLANVCDDITQGITHIIRGDDHVENTYRHLFLFHALGAVPPRYGHLPMIVNDSGKPYSKRDGDAFVGDFRTKGFLPEALFNYLSLLGWSPGDEREKMSRAELVQAFSLDRVQKSAAQMDLKKLLNLNGQYMAAMAPTDFLPQAVAVARTFDWGTEAADGPLFAKVAGLLQSRTKVFTDIETWKYFFVDLPDYDAKALDKFLRKPGISAALCALAEKLENVDFSSLEEIEESVTAISVQHDIPAGKLNQPVRIAVTGCTVGAGVYETMSVLGRARTCERLRYAGKTLCEDVQ